MNISGVLVMSRPERLPSVRAALDEMAGIEVHAATEDGRIIITTDDTDVAADDQHPLISIQNIPGVLSASLVYHHAEPNEPDEEIEP